MKTTYQENFCFISFRLKCSCPIRFWDSIIMNISGSNESMSSVFVER